MAGLSITKIILLFTAVLVPISVLYLYTSTWLEFICTSFFPISFTFFIIFHLMIRGMKPKTASINFHNKIVVITGGSSGIGLELAKQSINEGCKQVILIARNKNRLEDAVREINLIKKENQTATSLSIDLTISPVEIKNAVDKLLDDIKTVDILINSAGYSIPLEFCSSDVESFEQMMKVNYSGAVHLTHAIVPYMVKQKFGQLVFLSSVGGQLGVYGFTAYSPSKYAIRGFAEVLQQELRPFDIGVNVVFPPDTDTPGFENENKTKPKLTQLISEQAGIWKSEDVAALIISGIKERKFMIGFGSDGFFVNALTGGACPSSSVFEFCLQTLLMPIVKVYMLFMQNYFTCLIDDDFAKR